MNIKWNMTEDAWKELVNNHKRKDDPNFNRSDNLYGSCEVNNLCAEILHTHDDTDWYAFVNVYALGVNDGYGKTEDGTPYALLDDGPRVPLEAVTFDEFKTLFEESFNEYLSKQN